MRKWLKGKLIETITLSWSRHGKIPIVQDGEMAMLKAIKEAMGKDARKSTVTIG